MKFILFFIPKLLLSRLVGFLVDIPLPWPINVVSIWIFAKSVGIDLSQAEKNISQYRNIGAFFVRNLKSDCRPIGSGFVSPVDGTLRDFGVANNGMIPQVKGIDYAVGDLLTSEISGAIGPAAFYNFYLAPHNYHQVHAPCDIKISKVVWIPGNLWPVNDWSLKWVPGVFVKNERIVALCESEFGRIAIVMVGATNVGKMTVAFDEGLRCEYLAAAQRLFVKEYHSHVEVKKGDRFGTFNMGSTVILILPRGHQFRGFAPKDVLMGESL